VRAGARGCAHLARGLVGCGVVDTQPHFARRSSDRRISAMPVDASHTREKLIDEAARAFATHGVYGASLIDITRRAGQKNRGALHYHFGSRAGVLSAVLERHVEFLARREGELLEIALAQPDDDVKSGIEAERRPATV